MEEVKEGEFVVLSPFLLKEDSCCPDWSSPAEKSTAAINQLSIRRIESTDAPVWSWVCAILNQVVPGPQDNFWCKGTMSLSIGSSGMPATEWGHQVRGCSWAFHLKVFWEALGELFVPLTLCLSFPRSIQVRGEILKDPFPSSSSKL